MDGMTSNAVPAGGWYPDPWEQSAFRWWDGYQWTAHVSDPHQPVQPALAAAPTHIEQLHDDTCWVLYPDAPAQWQPDPVSPGAEATAGSMPEMADVVQALLREAAGRRGLRMLERQLPEPGKKGRFLPVGKRPQGEESERSDGHTMQGRLWVESGPDARIFVRPPHGVRTSSARAGSAGAPATSSECTVVTVPLSDAVAEWITGVLIRTSSRTVSMGLKVSRVVPTRWVKQDLGAELPDRSYDVHIARDQDEIALFELFDPSFVEQVAVTLNGLGISADVFVRDGRFELTAYADLISGLGPGIGCANGAVTHVPGAPSPPLDAFVAVARDIHLRLEHEWQ